MSDFGLKMNGKILNDDEIINIMKDAPKIYKKHLIKYLAYCGNQLIGSKKHDGAIRKYLNKLKNKKGEQWSSKFVNLFNYKINNDTLQLKAGLLFTNKKKVHQIMEMLESGFFTNSAKKMIIPNWKNIQDVKLNTFHRMVNNKQLNMIFKSGKIYYIDKVTGNLLYTGTNTIKVKPQFNFDNLVHSVDGKILKKSEKLIEVATKDVERRNLRAISSFSG